MPQPTGARRDEWGSECGGATLTVGFVGAVIGGGIGYLLGRASLKYRPMPEQP